MKQKNLIDLFNRLQRLGFTYEEAAQLRRIEMTLHRWAELECGDGNDYASWGIERDETTGNPYMVTHPHNGPSRRRAIADREGGALRRLAKIVKARNEREGDDGWTGLCYYYQTDPRGCALYLVSKGDIPLGQSIDAYYTRGLAVCA